MRWKPALNAFAITFADRFPVRRNLLTKTAGNTVNEIGPLWPTLSDRQGLVRIEEAECAHAAMYTADDQPDDGHDERHGRRGDMLE